MAVPFELTRDGYETQIQTNYLAPYALTRALLPALEAAATSNKEDPHRVRVVNVSSSGHGFAPSTGIDFNDINLKTHTGELGPWYRLLDIPLTYIFSRVLTQASIRSLKVGDDSQCLFTNMRYQSKGASQSRPS
jgi:NAD(P)-dependent dehydrogenase (short-subunit alcohol dehydrogenase family)